MCVGFSFGGTHYDDDGGELVLARKGYSLQVYTFQTSEGACICLHIVVMQALMKLAENVLLCTSDRSVCGYFFFLCKQSSKTTLLVYP